MNGCYNRAPFKTQMVVPDGFWDDGLQRIPKLTSIPFRMSTECNYSRDPMGVGQKDPACEGCKHKVNELGKEVCVS